jgi:FtsH-binding integral membrane protein
MFMTSPGVKAYMQTNTWPIWVSLFGTFGVLGGMMCNPEILRTYPHNYTLLGVFTLLQSVMIGTVCMVRTDAHALPA